MCTSWNWWPSRPPTAEVVMKLCMARDAEESRSASWVSDMLEEMSLSLRSSLCWGGLLYAPDDKLVPYKYEIGSSCIVTSPGIGAPPDSL